MEITEIKVNELGSFIESEKYRQFHPKPITELRAISQLNNPDSEGNETALVVAHVGSQVIGFAGLISRKMNGAKEPIFSNSCWWSDYEKGKGTALPVFLKAFKLSHSRMFLSDNTEHSRNILEKTGLFHYPSPINGLRLFYRFYLKDLSLSKFPKFKFLSTLFYIFDKILNTLWTPLCYIALKRIDNSELSSKIVNKISPELEDFIKEHAKNELIEKTAEYFNWIKRYPWVKKSKDNAFEYPFTYHVRKYHFEYLKISKNDQIVGFFAFSIRDNIAKIPFFYYEPQFKEQIQRLIKHFILKRKADSLAVFHPDLVDYFKDHSFPAFFKKNVQKHAGISQVLQNESTSKLFLQDGDGDFVFT